MKKISHFNWNSSIIKGYYFGGSFSSKPLKSPNACESNLFFKFLEKWQPNNAEFLWTLSERDLRFSQSLNPWLGILMMWRENRISRSAKERMMIFQVILIFLAVFPGIVKLDFYFPCNCGSISYRSCCYLWWRGGCGRTFDFTEVLGIIVFVISFEWF